jgi:hypothetical protein
MMEAFLQLTVPQIKAEMEKTLQWLVPIATNTTKYILYSPDSAISKIPSIAYGA